MTMTIEERKLYNEKYYASNKQRIADMLLVKIECPLCSKYISKANLERHKLNKTCSKNQTSKKPDIIDIKEQIERLFKQIEELRSK